MTESALLLVGHGSSRVAGSRQATVDLAEALRQTGQFTDVQPCFCREQPRLSLDLVDAPVVFVVPNFSGVGFFTRQFIPQALGLTGRLTRTTRGRIVYTDPVGTHPDIPRLITRDAVALCAARNWAARRTALLIIGHGSSQPGGASQTPEAVAADIRAEGTFAQVATAYIEQAPFLADWPRHVGADQVIAAPLLVSRGVHADRDLPRLLAEGAIAGKTAHLMDGLAAPDAIAAMVADLVRRAALETDDDAIRPFGH